MKTILVTGANGQLGQSLKVVAKDEAQFNIVFKDSTNLDITNPSHIEDCFKNSKIDWCVNCAAYTAVDKAEDENKIAERVNVLAVEHLAELCKKYHTKLIHISTDFVFDGTTKEPYKEDDSTNPIGSYGKTKLEGENAVKAIMNDYYIIRTSWLYSEFGSNFFKTMLRLSKEKKNISVVNDQIGTPTYAKELAKMIYEFIKKDGNHYGVYHYSNEGETSWYGFAKAIFEESKLQANLSTISTKAFGAKAARPQYSVLDKRKIKGYLQIDIPYWRDSLKECLKNYSTIENTNR